MNRYVIQILVIGTFIADGFTVSWSHAVVYGCGVLSGVGLYYAWRNRE